MHVGLKMHAESFWHQPRTSYKYVCMHVCRFRLCMYVVTYVCMQIRRWMSSHFGISFIPAIHSRDPGGAFDTPGRAAAGQEKGIFGCESMHVCMWICMYVCMYVERLIRQGKQLLGKRKVFLGVKACMYVCGFACMYVCMWSV